MSKMLGEEYVLHLLSQLRLKDGEIESLTAELEQKTREVEHFREEYIKLNQFETTQSAKLLQRCGELEHKMERYREAEAVLSASVRGICGVTKHPCSGCCPVCGDEINKASLAVGAE